MKKMNNKGFSLVELIIVIAIMAILIVVLAPQYLKYVEKSRVSADQASIEGYIDAMQVIAADPDITLTNGGGTEYSVKSTAGAKTVTVSSDLQTLFEDQGIMDSDTSGGCNLGSTAYTDAAMDIELKYDATKKVWQVTKVSGDVEVSGAIPTT